MRRVWLFEIGTTRWATETYTYGGNVYDGKVVSGSFSGLSLRRASDESPICSYADTSFEILDPPATDFTGNVCTCSLIVDTIRVAQFVFAVRRDERLYGKAKFYLTSLIEKYLEGDHPVRKQPRDIWPAGESEDARTDDYVIPQIFGDAFIPLRSVNTGTQRYYVLGPSTHTYTISKVRVPPEWNDSKDEWTAAAYAMNQSTASGYKLLQAIIKDDDGDGVADSPGIWEMGALDMPTRLTSTELSTTGGVSPADVIEQFLLDIGVPAAYIDTGTGSSFADAAAQYATWGVEWDGGFYRYMSREARLSNLLNQCASYLVIADKIELHTRPNSTDSPVFSIDSSDTISDSFNYSPIWPSSSDGIHVEYVANLDTPQNVKTKILVWSDPANTSVDDIENPASTVLDCYLIHDEAIAQRLGVMLANRLLEKTNRVNFQIVPSAAHLTLKPDQVITITDVLYGATRNVLVSSVSIDEGMLVSVEAIQFSTGVIAFDDMTPLTYAPPDDSNINPWRLINTQDGVDWEYVFGTNQPSDNADVTKEALEIVGGLTTTGTLMLSDGTVTKAGMTASGAGDTNVRIWAGDTYANRATAPFRVTQGGDLVSTSGEIGGFTIGATTLTATNLLLDAGNQIIKLGSLNNIIALDATDATYRLAIGHATYASASFRVTKEGVLTATGANITGAITGSTIDIGGADATSFHVDTDGNLWSGAATFNIATNPFAVSSAGVLRAVSGSVGGWTLSDTALSGTSSILKAAGVLSLGTGTDAYATANRIYIDGPNNKMSVGAGFKVENGTITSTAGTIGGWALSETTLTGTGVILSSIGDAYLAFGTTPPTGVATGTGIFINKTGLFGLNANTQNFKIDATNGNITAIAGTIGGWALADGKISIAGIELDQANNRIRAYAGANYVDITAGGLEGVDSILGSTFKIPTDGSAPYFSSGVIKECTYEVYTSGVIKTAIDPTATGGLLINNTRLAGYDGTPTKLLEFIYSGTDKGDAYIGDYDNSNPGIKYDHSAGTLSFRGDIAVESMYALPSDENLVGYWAFDDGSGTVAVDGSGNGNDGAISGGPSWIDGRVGTGIDFDTNSTISIAGVGAHSTYTFSLWWKRSASATTSYKSLLSSTSNQHHLIAASGTFTLGVWDGSFKTFGYTLPDDGIFHHLAVIFVSGSSASLYVDGVLKGSANHSLNLNTYQINRIGGYGGNYYVGPLDEVRIYNAALTVSEIKALYLYPAGNKGTRISGNQITTGVIQSNNWTTSAGSDIDLDNGTIKLGGSSSPAFSVTSAGVLTATGANLNSGTLIAGVARSSDSKTYLDLDNQQLYFNEKSTFASTTSGIFLGLDGLGYKFNVGDAASYFKYDGAGIDIALASGDSFDLAGELYIDGSLILEETIGPNNYGIIKKRVSGADQTFIHDYRPAGSVGDNLFIGERAGNLAMSYTSGFDASNNIGIGYNSLHSITSGYFNIALGPSSQDSITTGFSNVSIGTASLTDLTTGSKNIAIGDYAGSNHSGSTNNNAVSCISVGYKSHYSNDSSDYCIAIGEESSYNLTYGNYNIAIGYKAQYGNISGQYNTSLGVFSLEDVAGGANIGIGAYAGTNVSTGNYNTLIGTEAGFNITSGSSNIIIGYGIDAPSATGSNQLNIANVLFGSLALGKIGIGTNSPDYELDVAGDIGINQHMYHNGDTDTFINFETDRIRFQAGGEYLIDVFEGTQDYVKLGDGGDVDINLNDVLTIDGLTGIISGNHSKNTSESETLLLLRNTNTSDYFAPAIEFQNSSSGFPDQYVKITAGLDEMVISGTTDNWTTKTDMAHFKDTETIFPASLAFKEVTTSPGTRTNFGQIYTKSDNKLYFKDGDGTEYTVNLTAV